MVDTKALKERISESGMTVAGISRKTGILRETFYNRIKTGDFKLSEMCALTKALNLSKDERDAIFFAKECELNSLQKQKGGSI